MDGPSAVGFGILIPALIAGIVLLVSARRARGEPAVPRPIAGALALGLGYLVAHAGLKAFPAWPWSDDQLDMLSKVYWMIAAAILLAPLRGTSFLARYGNSLYVALFAILPYHYVRAAGEPRSGLDLAGFGSVLLVYGIWMSLERLASRRPGPSLPIALWGASVGTAAMLLANTSALQAQIVGSLAAGLGAAVVVALIVRGSHLASGAVAILAVAIGAGVRNAVIYDLPTVCWVLVAAAFAGPWLGEIPSLRQRSPRFAGLVAFLAAFVPAAAAAWLAYDARAPSAY